MIKKHLKSFFSFSKKELNGLLVFCFLLVGVIAFPLINEWLMPKEVFSFDQFKKEIIAYRASIAKEKSYAPKWANTNIGDLKKAEYFMFNPNDLSVERWKKLGLTDRQIEVIKNYESKGGRFYKKEDLKKIYSISHTDYRTLEPFIKIPEEQGFKSGSSTNSYPREEKERKEVVIEINTADSVQLEMIRGIGPAFASRIIKYRSRLGGFYMKEQLKEVFGLDSAKFEEIKDQVRTDPSMIRKISINTASFEDMKRHPYLTYNQMNAIIQYRRQHGNYNNVSDIRKITIINEENFRKIEPYLNL